VKRIYLSSKKLQILLHIAAWIIIIILPQYLLRMNWARNLFFAGRLYMSTAIYGMVFYLNFFWLIPKLFLKGRRFSYVFSAITAIVIFYFVLELCSNFLFHEFERERQLDEILSKTIENNLIGEREFRKPPEGSFDPAFAFKEDSLTLGFRNRRLPIPPPPGRFHMYNFLFTAVLISGFSLGLRVSNQFTQNEKQRKELEKEKLNSELAFLKNQISPHLFFNTLNNIYSLIGINTEDSQKAVLKLSKLMRYLLYESEQQETQLSREIDFMNNYIDLMRLRMSDKVELLVSFPVDYANIPVPSLLFIPFIENAFKYGITYREKSFIHIFLEAKNNAIVFRCSNSIGEASKVTPSEYLGIGLENVKKRLNLLFPNNYHLEIEHTAELFNVNLIIHT
jgi:two-component system, LytTR family, sensor kinase